jgi:hypothetical protein
MAEKASFSNVRHEPPKLLIDMLLNHSENKVHREVPLSEAFVPVRTETPALSENGIKEFGIYRLVFGGLIFIGLTVGIFWYQFAQIPDGNRPGIWNQLQWHYIFWLLLFLPIDTLASPALRFGPASRQSGPI